MAIRSSLRAAPTATFDGDTMTGGASTLMDMRLLAAQAVAREAGAIARLRFLDQSFTVGFIGEESKGRPAGEGGAAWVVDPIDGTANFARAVPQFCVSIACVAAGKVEVGVIYDPMRDELFAARRGGGARLNGALIRASDATSLASSSVEIGWDGAAGRGASV